MPMVSYAQNQEDVLLRRVFSHGNDGFYIDVGANDPVQDSVTKHFYDRGWRGINIEPQSGRYACLNAQRRNDINLNIGLSNCEGTLTFQECVSHDGVSTFSPDIADVWRERGMKFVERTVPVKTLAQVCEEYVNRPIDFMKIDVEAHEYEVIVGGDWHRWRPRVVLVEAHWIERWEPLLLAVDYHFATFDGLNRYYVRGEDRQLLSAFATPIHVLDDYVPYRYLSRIEELGAQLASAQAGIQELRAELATTKLVTDGLRAHGGPALYKDLGPNAIRVALGLHRVAARFPTISSTVKRITRLGA